MTCPKAALACAVLTSIMQHSMVASAPSTLKVAVCNPGSAPYLTVDANGTAKGFDIDLWNAAYDSMLKTVLDAKSVPNPLITPEVEALVGDSRPKLQIFQSQEIQNRLAAKTLDLGMCGFFITLDRLQNFDYVNPYYFPSGFQAVVKKPSTLPSMMDVLTAIVGCIDSKAQLIILILLLFCFIFGHVIAGAEQLVVFGDSKIRKGYFESTQDGMWFSIVIMSTVGFGDIYPLSILGRFLTITWIFLSISFMAMLLAVITTRFLTLDLIPDNPVYHITGMSSLEDFQVVTATNVAYTVLRRSYPEMNVTKYPTNRQDEVFRAVLNGSFPVAVERPETIQYFNNFVPEFRGRLMPIGAVFNQEGVALGISRPDGHAHPLNRLLSLAVARLVATESWISAARLKWFGPEPAIADSDALQLRADLKERAVAQVLWAAVQVLIAIACIWAGLIVLATAARVPPQAVRNETCAAARVALGVREEEALGGRPGTLGYHALKTQVLAGLRRLLDEDEARGARTRCSPDQIEAALARTVPHDAAPPRRLLGTRGAARDPGPKGSAVAAFAEPNAVHISVAALLDRIAAELAARRPTASWWERAVGLDYVRHGRVYARAAFMKAYLVAERVLDEQAAWDGAEDDGDMQLLIDDAADVLMELMVLEERGLLKEGGPVFPHRPRGGSRFGDEERSFDQLTRETRELHARIRTVDAAAAAAAAAAAEALRATGQADSDVAGPEAWRSGLGEGGAMSFRHRFQWAQPQS